MTHLRKLTLDEIARRNYTESTTRTYIRLIADFARYFHRSPDQLGPDQVASIPPTRFATWSSPTTPSIKGLAHCDSSFAES